MLAVQLLDRRGLRRKLEKVRCPYRPNNLQITLGMARAFCRSTHHVGLQDANHHRNVYDRGGVHRSLHQLKGGHPHDGDAPGGKGAWSSSGLSAPKVLCTVFEDNSGALELARLPKIRPRTKHINQSYHHFREHVERQEVYIHATRTEAQLADILTKPLPEASFTRHRKAIMGW